MGPEVSVEMIVLAVDDAGLQHVLREITGCIARCDLLFGEFEIEAYKGVGVGHG